MAIVRELVTRLGWQIDEAGAKKYEQRVEKLTRDLQTVGIAATAAAAGLVLPAAQVEENVARALTLMGVTGNEFERMKQRMTSDAFRLARDLKTSASEISSGYYDVLSAGVPPTAAGFEQLVETATKLSRTTGLTMAESVELTTTTLKQFNMEMTESARVADLLFGATRPVQVTLPQLSQSLREASVAASSVNADLPTTLALLDALAEKGIRANVAGTALRIIFTRLSAPTGNAAQELKKLGISVIDPVTGKFRDMFDVLQDLRVAIRRLPEAQRNLALKTIAGEEAFAKLGAILETDNARLQELRTEIGGATGALQDADDAISSTTRFALQRFGGALKNVAAIMGSELSEETEALLNVLSDSLDTLGEFLEKNPEFIEAATNLVKLALAVGLLGIAMRNLDKILLASKFGLILLAIDEILAFFTEREGALEGLVKRVVNGNQNEKDAAAARAFIQRRREQIQRAQETGGNILFPNIDKSAQPLTQETNIDKSVVVNINGPVTQETVDHAVDRVQELQDTADGL